MPTVGCGRLPIAVHQPSPPLTFGECVLYSYNMYVVAQWRDMNASVFPFSVPLVGTCISFSARTGHLYLYVCMYVYIYMYAQMATSH